MGLGLSVISSNKVGAAEIFEGRAKELIFESENVDELRAKIELLIENENLRNEVGQLNIHTANKYSEQRQGQKLIDILKSRSIV